MRTPLAGLLLLVACGPTPPLMPVTVGGGVGSSVGGGQGGSGGGSTASGGGTQAPPSHADGVLEAWQQARALPVARANHCAVAFGEHLIVAGGNYKPSGSMSFLTLDDVQVAKVDAQGALQAWVQGGTLPGPAVDCVLAVDGSTLYLFGGLFDDTAMNQKVWSTPLSADGHLGAWTELGTLPYGRRPLGTGARVKGSTVWLTDSRLPSEGAAEAVLATATLTGNVLGAWTKTAYAMEFRGKPLGAFTDHTAFVIGGYGDANTVLTDVVAAPLDGAMPALTTALPEGRTYGAAVFVDGYLYAIGGRTQVLGIAPLPTTFSAPVIGDATVGAWTAQRAMPQARSNVTATVVGDWLFVVGGGNNGGGLDTVFSARVKHAATQ